MSKIFLLMCARLYSGCMNAVRFELHALFPILATSISSFLSSSSSSWTIGFRVEKRADLCLSRYNVFAAGYIVCFFPEKRNLNILNLGM